MGFDLSYQVSYHHDDYSLQLCHILYVTAQCHRLVRLVQGEGRAGMKHPAVTALWCEGENLEDLSCSAKLLDEHRRTWASESDSPA